MTSAAPTRRGPIAGEIGGRRFAAQSALPASPLCSLSKLRWQRSHAPGAAAAVRWLGVPEWIARSLGGADVAELSLASRTGTARTARARMVGGGAGLVGPWIARVRSQLFALAHHPARDRDLKVKREKPIYRRYLEADELLDVLDAALAIDQRSTPETLQLAETVRRLREIERLQWNRVAARLGRAESTAIWLSR